MINKLKEILFSTTDVNRDIQIDENTVILRDLGLNSLELIEVVCEVEDAFDIEIPDKKIKSIITIGDLINVIESEH